MPDIRIHRDHKLGLPKARQVASAWAEEVESKFDMACTYTEGPDAAEGDKLEFSRLGVSGTLHVGSDHFELNARLGFLLGAFSKTIESEIERHLDELLIKGAKAAAPARKASNMSLSRARTGSRPGTKTGNFRSGLSTPSGTFMSRTMFTGPSTR